MPANRPAIPADIERELRREAGFGCCKCGLPILEYHHIIPYAQSQAHKAADMMCLCPLHHAEADRASSEAEQREWKLNPANITKGFANGTLKTTQSAMVVDAGRVQFIGTECLVRIDRRELFKLEVDSQGRVLISVELLDKQNRLLVRIDQNQWQSGDCSLWDIKADFQRLVVREKGGEVSLEVDTTHGYVRFRGCLWHNGALVRITPSGIRHGKLMVNDSLQKGGHVSNMGLVCMTIAVDTKQQMTALVPTGPNSNGLVVVEDDKDERIRKGIAAYKELMSNPPENPLEHLFPPNL